jgi:hypothetical protein
MAAISADGNTVTGQRPAASDLADLFARARLGPQGKHELLADVDHQHVVAGEGGLPAQAVNIEPASPGEVGHD